MMKGKQTPQERLHKSSPIQLTLRLPIIRSRFLGGFAFFSFFFLFLHGEPSSTSISLEAEGPDGICQPDYTHHFFGMHYCVPPV